MIWTHVAAAILAAVVAFAGGWKVQGWRLGEQIADAVVEGIDPEGVLVVLEASHGCVADRGVKQVEATAVTIASRGSLSQPLLRAEVLALIGSSER